MPQRSLSKYPDFASRMEAILGDTSFPNKARKTLT